MLKQVIHRGLSGPSGTRGISIPNSGPVQEISEMSVQLNGKGIRFRMSGNRYKIDVNGFVEVMRSYLHACKPERLPDIVELTANEEIAETRGWDDVASCAVERLVVSDLYVAIWIEFFRHTQNSRLSLDAFSADLSKKNIPVTNEKWLSYVLKNHPAIAIDGRLISKREMEGKIEDRIVALIKEEGVDFVRGKIYKLTGGKITIPDENIRPALSLDFVERHFNLANHVAGYYLREKDSFYCVGPGIFGLANEWDPIVEGLLPVPIPEKTGKKLKASKVFEAIWNTCLLCGNQLLLPTALYLAMVRNQYLFDKNGVFRVLKETLYNDYLEKIGAEVHLNTSFLTEWREQYAER